MLFLHLENLKRAWEISVLAAATAVVLMALGYLSRNGSYDLSFSVLRGDTEKDFGEVLEGSLLEHVFQLSCEGQHSIVVNRIKLSCQCLAVTEDDIIGKVIHPGDEIAIGLRRQVNAAMGDQTVSAAIEYTSNGVVKGLSLMMSANVAADYLLSSDKLDLGELTEEDCERHFVVSLRQTGNMQKPVGIREVSCSSDAVTAILLDAERFALKYRHSENQKSEEIRIPVVVETTSALLRRSIVMLTGVYRQSIEVQPESIFVASTEDRANWQVQLHVRTAEDAIVKVDTSQCSFCDVPSPTTYRLSREHFSLVTLQLPASGATGLLEIIAEYPDGRSVSRLIPLVRF